MRRNVPISGGLSIAAARNLRRGGLKRLARGTLPLSPTYEEVHSQMGLVILLLILALIFGGVGLAAHALWWMLLIAAALVIASAIAGFGRRSVL